jgi:hypothetical protein
MEEKKINWAFTKGEMSLITQALFSYSQGISCRVNPAKLEEIKDLTRHILQFADDYEI